MLLAVIAHIHPRRGPLPVGVMVGAFDDREQIPTCLDGTEPGTGPYPVHRRRSAGYSGVPLPLAATGR